MSSTLAAKSMALRVFIAVQGDIFYLGHYYPHNVVLLLRRSMDQAEGRLDLGLLPLLSRRLPGRCPWRHALRVV